MSIQYNTIQGVPLEFIQSDIFRDNLGDNRDNQILFFL